MAGVYLYGNMVFRDMTRKGYYFFLCAIAFCLPFPFITSSVCVVGLLLCWLPAANVKHIAASFRGSPAAVCWIAYYALHALSYFYSADKGESLFDLQKKLSLLVLPLAIISGPGIKREMLSKILILFIAGMSLAAICCLGYAALNYSRFHNSDAFFYHMLVSLPFIAANAVYMAWYSFAALSFLLLHRWQLQKNGEKALLRVAIIIQLIFLLLLSSRLLLALFVVALVPMWLRQVSGIRHLSMRKITVCCLGIGALVCVATFTTNPISRRFSEVLHPKVAAVTTTAEGKKAFHFTNATLRVFLWRMGMDNVVQHQLWALGCGNGGVETLQTEQVQHWESRGYDFTYNQDLGKFNLHNMYLQSLLMLGIPGLLLFLGIVISPFFFLRCSGNFAMWCCFHIAACCFFFQESALQTQAGVIFFTFFSMIFWECVNISRNEKSLAKALPDY